MNLPPVRQRGAALGGPRSRIKSVPEASAARGGPPRRSVRSAISYRSSPRPTKREGGEDEEREARKEGKERGREKQGNFRKETREIDSQPTSPMPSGILRLSAAWKSHGYAKLPPLARKTAEEYTAGRGRERVRRRAGEKGEEEGGCEKIAETRLENPDGSRYFRAQKRYDAVPFRVRAR